MHMLLMRIKDGVFDPTTGTSAIKTKVSAVFDRIGAPAGASIAADLAAIKAAADTIAALVDPEVATILANSATLIADVEPEVAQIKTSTDRIGVPAGASVSADVAAVKADTTSIKGFVDTEVGAIKSAVDSQNVTLWPQLANEVVVTGAAGAWALGVLAQVIAAAQVVQNYNVDTVYLLATSAAFSGGELVLYHGAGDIEFARVAIHNGGAPMPIPLPSSKRIPANDQVKVALATKAGAAETASVKLGVHYG